MCAVFQQMHLHITNPFCIWNQAAHNKTEVLIPPESKAALERDQEYLSDESLFKGFAATCKKISDSLTFVIDFWAEIQRAKTWFKGP